MKKTNKLGEMMKAAETLYQMKKPAILVGLSLVGLAMTAYEAYKAGTKIEKIVKEMQDELEITDKDDKVAQREVKLHAAKKAAPHIAKVAIAAGATTMCILGSHNESTKRIAVLSAGYDMAEKALRDLNEKNIEVLGEQKAKVIKDAIAKDKVDALPPTEPAKVVITGNGDVPCVDIYTGGEFLSSQAKIDKAIFELSTDCISYNYVSLNDFRDRLGLDAIPLGNDLGWNANDLVHNMLPITTSAILRNDVPCIAINYDIKIREDYRNLM